MTSILRERLGIRGQADWSSCRSFFRAMTHRVSAGFRCNHLLRNLCYLQLYCQGHYHAYLNDHLTYYYRMKCGYCYMLARITLTGSTSHPSALLADAWTAFISSRSSRFDMIPFRSSKLMSASAWLTSEIGNSLKVTVSLGSIAWAIYVFKASILASVRSILK